ncbi:MAG: hypothetical protein Q4F31_07975 [Eubacteriales bacterium]|nr:hypothetical protein [Eubacteriales bacterium]
MGILFRHAAEDEVGILTEMSTDVFLSDTALGGEAGGPIGYDDYEFHLGHQKTVICIRFLGMGKSLAGLF